MRNLIGLSVCLILCGCFGKKPKIKTGLEGKPMPAIELLAADSTTIYNTTDLSPGKPTLLFSFETWCPYCKAQTIELLSHITSLKDINVYFICNTRFSEFKKFNKLYRLDKYPNISAGVDYNFEFQNYFQLSEVPCLAIYDKQNKLKRVFVGKTFANIIKEIAFH